MPMPKLFTSDQMPAMRRLWDEGLCDLEWAGKTDPEKRRVCRVCPVRALCENVGRKGKETGEIWGGWSGTDPHTAKDTYPVPSFDYRRKTCKHGHPWTPDNLAVQLGGTGHPSWVCILCSAASKRAHRAGRTLAQQIAIEATA